jgi:hypothetical protein
MVGIKVSHDDVPAGEGEGGKGAWDSVEVWHRVMFIVYVNEEKGGYKVSAYLQYSEIRAALPKDEALKTHLNLLHYLQWQPWTIITYTDGSQLGSSTGTGFYITTGLHCPIRMIVPMGDMAEVFDTELRAIYECLWTCYHHLCQDGLHHHRIHIFTDNQVAIT